MRAPPQPPGSVTHTAINLAGFFSGSLAIILLTGSDISRGAAAVFCVLAAALPIMIGEVFLLKVYRRPTTGLDFSSARPLQVNVKRVLTKLMGLLATLAIISFVYWLLPEYNTDFYDPFLDKAPLFLPGFILLAVPYFVFVDSHMIQPKDGYWHMGQLVWGRWRALDYTKLKEHWLGWTIKAFFLPLMLIFLNNNIGWLMSHPFKVQSETFIGTYFWCLNFLYYIDLIFAVAGYLMTLRLVDAHIRSSHPFFFGWFVTLLCYPPFWAAVSGKYFKYEDAINWLGWLKNYPSVQMIWGILILTCVAVYGWATVTFGLRFSNLTHRGILTNGPFRFTKHPAYISKNLSWWLISIPFIPGIGMTDAFRNCCLLLMVNAIYFFRAKMEEKHLSRDPTYVTYALWIEEHGIFRHISRYIPALKYMAPAASTSSR